MLIRISNRMISWGMIVGVTFSFFSDCLFVAAGGGGLVGLFLVKNQFGLSEVVSLPWSARIRALSCRRSRDFIYTT